ncbi:MAG: aminotransferase DegT [Deltaproteobacteria bacterium RIFCSPLOWO2_12_FULL_40_28]|nr:MAG: aminotransferase DegT [Deltaproteobacteria bacterium RIFCSPHIGHO2_02_FULL_40_28]OGQ19574.1 MAG: aminotransferase DegT [Deltaproteobacteria bacterium RIFCSPHIGHO2_12_FULL_40_32]OGQ40851.1 MAG: aminotransferase DegT [Deltaproteobacteria bacterium RIFCSPLOWO2_02_FULL_40_36]OGQ53966.1 MAG: aminotransferase DegT [Deltaproteobacteria bacterium RIFCSPLOWO2_12_FULL_40_28]
MIPLSVPYLKGNELKYVSQCIETEWVSTAGRFVTDFEKCIAEFAGSKHAIACVNGTAALHLSLQMEGVQTDDEVLVPTLTFIAPVNAVCYLGAHPVFMDCDDHLNLDPEKLQDFLVKECFSKDGSVINKKTERIIKAVIVVHVFGHPARLDLLKEICSQFQLSLIEDATESLGSYLITQDGTKIHTGTIGDFGCLSFNGNKLVTTGGGGMILTSNQAKALHAKHLTTQAKTDELYSIHDEVGYNYRLTNLQAAVGLAQMESIVSFLKIKRANFEKYKKALSSLSQISWITEPVNTQSNHWFYALQTQKTEGVGSRDDLMHFLLKKDIQCRALWRPNHLQKPYKHCQSYKIEKALHFSKTILNIPCSLGITEDEISTVSKGIKDYYGA